MCLCDKGIVVSMHKECNLESKQQLCLKTCVLDIEYEQGKIWILEYKLNSIYSKYVLIFNKFSLISQWQQSVSLSLWKKCTLDSHCTSRGS